MSIVNMLGLLAAFVLGAMFMRIIDVQIVRNNIKEMHEKMNRRMWDEKKKEFETTINKSRPHK